MKLIHKRCSLASTSTSKRATNYKIWIYQRTCSTSDSQTSPSSRQSQQHSAAYQSTTTRAVRPGPYSSPPITSTTFSRVPASDRECPLAICLYRLPQSFKAPFNRSRSGMSTTIFSSGQLLKNAKNSRNHMAFSVRASLLKRIYLICRLSSHFAVRSY